MANTPVACAFYVALLDAFVFVIPLETSLWTQNVSLRDFVAVLDTFGNVTQSWSTSEPISDVL